MQKWLVTLPGNLHYTLESDAPAETLSTMGYSAFSLMELDGPAMSLWREYLPVPGSAGRRKRESMGKVIDFPVPGTEVLVFWYIDIVERERLLCQYVTADESEILHKAHWRVVVEAATVSRLRDLLKEAEVELSKSKAARSAAGRRSNELCF